MTSELELRREIRSLLRERSSLKTSIRRISAQLDSDAASTLLSTKTANESTHDLKNKQQDDMELAVDLEKRPKPETPRENLDNQKRILRAGLLGHLQRARDALVRDREKESTIKHMQKEQIVASKLEKLEQEKLKTLSEELRSQLSSNEERLSTVESTLMEKNNSIMKIQLTRHYECMGNFIATKTQPTVFWMPRNFNSELEALRDTTKQFITQKVAAIASTDYFSTDINIE